MAQLFDDVMLCHVGKGEPSWIIAVVIVGSVIACWLFFFFLIVVFVGIVVMRTVMMLRHVVGKGEPSWVIVVVVSSSITACCWPFFFILIVLGGVLRTTRTIIVMVVLVFLVPRTTRRRCLGLVGIFGPTAAANTALLQREGGVTAILFEQSFVFFGIDVVLRLRLRLKRHCLNLCVRHLHFFLGATNLSIIIIDSLPLQIGGDPPQLLGATSPRRRQRLQPPLQRVVLALQRGRPFPLRARRALHVPYVGLEGRAQPVNRDLEAGIVVGQLGVGIDEHFDAPVVVVVVGIVIVVSEGAAQPGEGQSTGRLGQQILEVRSSSRSRIRSVGEARAYGTGRDAPVIAVRRGSLTQESIARRRQLFDQMRFLRHERLVFDIPLG
mmetsp:Transcript_2982/g.6564  ORF Transcript_2982/g.6564 Transcript_2982/m.6564 type:complete len:381 (-) Transcript_2982:8-1150(-)